MYPEERREAMSRLVAERRRLSVIELADEFDVTTETVRRDLSHLERSGQVRRTHGGAVPADALTAPESGMAERDQTNPHLKDLIAKAAISLLPPDGSSVVVDAGSTTVRLAAAVPPERRLTVFTHAVPVASRLMTLPHLDLHLLPGRVRPTTQAAVGGQTVAAVAALRVDVAFLGTNAVSAEHGFSTPDADEAATKSALVEVGRRVVVLADSSKLDSRSTLRFAATTQVDVLVTDPAADPAELRRLERTGIEVVVA